MRILPQENAHTRGIYTTQSYVILQEENNFQEDQNAPDSWSTHPQPWRKPVEEAVMNTESKLEQWSDVESWLDSWNYKLRVPHQHSLGQFPNLSQTGREKKW